MEIRLSSRTAEHVRIYFEKTRDPEIQRALPQKAQSVEEALLDFQRTLLPGSNSFGQTIYADGKYIGDVWCYCIDMSEEPNCMISYCIFDKTYWSQGCAARAVRLFIQTIRKQFGVRTIGAFTFSFNTPSLKVLEKNGFVLMEEFEENGILSKYLQYSCN